jgi:stress response protein YsnF
MSSSQTVIGIFGTKEQARIAADHLVSQGFDKDTIDLSAHGSDILDTKDHDRTDSFFTNLLGREDTQAVNYREAARRGTVLTVHTTEMKNAERAAAIMDEHGALNVGDREQDRRAHEAMNADRDRTTDKDRDLTNKDRTIPVIEENIEVGKKEVTTGGVNLRSRIIEKPIEKNLRLREEHVHVDRKNVDRPASKRDMDTFKEGETKIVERAEVPLVNKEARVVEEVRVGKETTSHDETVRDTVRRTDVDVDRIDADRDVDRNRDIDRNRDNDLNRNV